MIMSKEHFLVLLILSAPFLGSYVSTILAGAGQKQSIINPVFSNCSNCGHQILLIHKIPILAYIILKGACYLCKTPISWTYITLETGFLISSVLAILVLPNQTFDRIFFAIILAWIFLPLSIFDIQKQRLPDLATIPLACAALVQGYFLPYVNFIDCLFGLILGFVLSATVSISYCKIRGQTGLGWGDVKLISAVGALIGWQFLPWFVFFASISALMYVILQIIIRGRQAGRERIPFGPFLCGSCWLVWLYSIS